MLKNTFLHFPGIGLKTERRLWNGGICSWDDLENKLGMEKEPRSAGKKLPPSFKNQLEISRKNYEERKASFFAGRLPPNQAWRLFADFRGNAAFLDIETTGLGGDGDHITTISLYDGRSLSYYVWGENMQDFPRDIARYSLLVTYNGKCFDLPFIERYFKIKLDQHAHLDLRFILAGLGYKGGLKSCEKQLGISRGDLEGVDGYMAVLLWQEYRRHGNIRALETLLSYNMEDTINLELLAYLAYNELIAFTPFQECKLALPPSSRVEVPFKAAPEIIEKLRRGLKSGFAG